MGQLVFQAALGGQVALSGPNTASSFTVAVPAVTGTMVTTGDTATVTSTMISGPLTSAVGGTGINNGSATLTLAGNVTHSGAFTQTFTATGNTSLTLPTSGTLQTTTGSLASNTGLPLTTGVTGTLPVANGGTNLTSFTANGVVYASSTSALATGSALTFDGANLGIGTTSPGQKLEVNGGVRVAGSATLGTALPSGVMSFESPIMRCYVGDGTGYSWAFSKRTASVTTDLMTLTDAGNLGIGTTSPANFLDISKTQDAETSIGLSNTSTGANAQVRTKYTTNSGLFTVGTTGTAHPFGGDAYIYQVANKGIRFATNDTERMRIKATGDIKIQAGNLLGWSDYSAGSTGVGITATNENLLFYSSGTERARIDSSGNLILGTTSATEKLRIYSDMNANWGIGMRSTAGAVAQNYIQFVISAGGTPTQVGSITSNGTITVYGTTSDYRLKNTIAPMTGALDKVALLKPCTYKWNSNGFNGEGFIAHELAEVVPDCVSGAKDAVDADGNPVYQGIDTSFLVATLTAALQELNAKFEAYVASHP